MLFCGALAISYEICIFPWDSMFTKCLLHYHVKFFIMFLAAFSVDVFLMLIIPCLWATAPDRETNFHVSLSPSSSNQIFTVTLWRFSDLVLDLLLSKGEWQEQGSSWNRRRTLCTSAYGHSSVSDCHLSAFLSHMTIVDNLIYKKFYVPAWPTML